MNWLVNLAIYEGAWFACVLGGDALAWVAALLLAVHLYLTPCPRADLLLAGALLFVGLVLDGTLKAVGFFSFDSPIVPIPLWLMGVWATFATLPNHSLAWLKKRLGLAAVLGAVGGPLAYWAGVRMGAATFNWPLLPSLLLLAVVWGGLMPGVMRLSSRLAPERG
jgi:hypothetical protein